MRSAGLPHTLPCLLKSFLWPLCLSGCQWYLALIISHLPLSLLITRPGLSPCNYLGSVSPWGRISGPGRERMWDKVWLWLRGRHRRPQADPLPLNHRKHLQYHSRRLSGQVEESIFLECSKRSGMQVQICSNYRTQLKWLADRYLDVYTISYEFLVSIWRQY